MFFSGDLTIFLLTSVLLAMTPGPDNLYVLTQSALYGRKTGVIITLGLCSGLIVHILAVVIGIATLLTTSPAAFLLLKVIGASYLLYLAWRAFKAAPISTLKDGVSLHNSIALLRTGFLMNVSNPKVAIFFLAFLPQFVEADKGYVSVQILCLGLIFMASALLVFFVIAMSAAKLGKWLLRSACAQNILHTFTAVIFILLAGRLLFIQP